MRKGEDRSSPWYDRTVLRRSRWDGTLPLSDRLYGRILSLDLSKASALLAVSVGRDSELNASVQDHQYDHDRQDEKQHFDAKSKETVNGR